MSSALRTRAAAASSLPSPHIPSSASSSSQPTSRLQLTDTDLIKSLSMSHAAELTAERSSAVAEKPRATFRPNIHVVRIPPSLYRIDCARIQIRLRAAHLSGFPQDSFLALLQQVFNFLLSLCILSPNQQRQSAARDCGLYANFFCILFLF